MIAEIIGVGQAPGALDPIAQMFAREVSLLGVDLHFQTDARNDRMLLAQAMAQSLRRSDIIITAGGVGMEAGDYTKEVICQGLGIPMDLHTESYQRIQAWFEAAGLPVPPGAQKAALLPRGGVMFPGEDGGAPGAAITAGDQCILMLPGRPDELCPMFMNYVVPFLAKFTGATIVSRVARLFGVDERETLQRLYDLQNSRNPAMTLYTQKGEVLVRVTARANNRQQAANMCTPFLKEIVGRMGDFVYGIDVESLESVVITHLAQKGLLLGAAENGTGGLLMQKLNLVPGAGNVLKFGVSARAAKTLGLPERLIKKAGMVSDRVAVHMACGAMDAGGADIGLAITGVCEAGGEQPGGLCYIAACTKDRVVVKRLSLPPDTPSTVVREMAVRHALNLVRLILDYDPDPAPGAIPLGAALKGKIDLCDELPAASTGEELAAMDAPRHSRRGDGPDPRTIIMIVLMVILLAAIGFIGYALYERFFPEGLPFFNDTSSSESSAEEDPDDDRGRDDEDEDPDRDNEDDEDEESSKIGPAIGRGDRDKDNQDNEEDPSPDDEEDPDASFDNEDTIPASAPAESSSAPASVTEMPVTPPSSSSTAEVSSAAPSSSSSTAPAPKPSSSSSGASSKDGFLIEPGMVYNVYTGEYVSRSSSEEDDDDGDDLELPEVRVDPDDYPDDTDEDNDDDDSDTDRTSHTGKSTYSPSEKITVKANGSSNVTASLQEIVERIVQVEMGSSFDKEALKAQAVAAYSYVEYALARGQTPNVMLAGKSSVSSKVSSAVEDVIGEEIQYGGKVINATYFASSAGVTNNSEDVWTDKLPYLRSVESSEDVKDKTVRISQSKMRSAIRDEFGFDPDDYASPEDWISDITYCKNGEYVDEIEFCGEKSKPGAWVRANMLTSLSSHAFDVEYDGEDFVFTVRGAGHGVGMSQVGAQAMAEDGYSYDEILEHYYTGASVG